MVNTPFDDADGRFVVLVNDAGWNDYRDTVRPQQALPVGGRTDDRRRRGQVGERGSYDELLAVGRLYANLYRTQFTRRPPERAKSISG